MWSCAQARAEIGSGTTSVNKSNICLRQFSKQRENYTKGRAACLENTKWRIPKRQRTWTTDPTTARPENGTWKCELETGSPTSDAKKLKNCGAQPDHTCPLCSPMCSLGWAGKRRKNGGHMHDTPAADDYMCIEYACTEHPSGMSQTGIAAASLLVMQSMWNGEFEHSENHNLRYFSLNWVQPHYILSDCVIPHHAITSTDVESYGAISWLFMWH